MIFSIFSVSSDYDTEKDDIYDPVTIAESEKIYEDIVQCVKAGVRNVFVYFCWINHDFFISLCSELDFCFDAASFVSERTCATR